MIHELSAGFVIFRVKDQVREYLLLQYPRGHIDLPRGHLKKGENTLQAAYRELEEETGIYEFTHIPGFMGENILHFNRGTQMVEKKVIFYLGQAINDQVTLSHEHIDYFWLPFPQAYQKITFQNAKNLIENAEKFIIENKI